MDGTFGDVGLLLSLSRREVVGLSGRMGSAMVVETRAGARAGLVQVVSSVLVLK